MKQEEMTLRDKILLLDLKPRSAPEGIKPATFGKWLRAVKKGREIGPIATGYLTLLCDGRLNSDGGMIVEPKVASHANPMLITDAMTGIPHEPINLMPGTFTVRGGVRVFNLDGMFWSGGRDGVIVISGAPYEYRDDKNFGNFKKTK